ncbi:MAG: hypothetical protein ACT4PJ_11815 [Gemmatimonadaceae bacterium]
MIRNRLLLVDSQDRITYDRFLSLVETHGVDDALVRKVMYFVWAWRDDRIRRFITDVIAEKSGGWSVTRLLDKNSATFFEQFGKGAPKVRSNYEFFLFEAGIVTKARKVDLALADGWLSEAMLVAMQHEPDPAIRAAMVRSPVDVLFQLGLNALANLTEADRGTAPAHTVPDFVQEEPDSLLAPTAVASEARDWKDRSLTPPTGGKVTAVINLVALERANASHLLLERLLARRLSANALKAESTDSIDMLVRAPAGTLMCEMKSCTSRNFHGQVRRGVSQLLEYRFLYREKLKADPVLVLVVEAEPPTKKRWLADYLRSIGITLVWKEHGSDRLLTLAPAPPLLANLVDAL